MVEEHKKQFTGWWIPAYVIELFEDRTINAKELILLATIHEFVHRGKGCFASNEYLGNLVHVAEEQVRRMISHLKELGLVVQTGFDGRKRWLSVPWSMEPQKSGGQTQQKSGDCPNEKVGHIKQVNKQASRSTRSLKRTRGRSTKRPPVTTFLSSEFDREAAALLRGVLVKYDSDLIQPPLGTRILGPLTKQIMKIRVDRNESEEVIMKVIAFLDQAYDDCHTPKLHKPAEICTRWKTFKDAYTRWVKDNGGELPTMVRNTSEHRRRVKLAETIRDMAEEREVQLSSSRVKKLLIELGEDPDLLTVEFVITGGKKE